MNLTSFLKLLFITICLSSCVATKNKNYTFNKKYSSKEVKEDIVLLKHIFEANHPSLYWYTTQDSIDTYFNETLASITDSITETAAKNKIAAIVSIIKCGHTSVRFSKQFLAIADKNKFPQFPLSIKTWKDSMVVLGYYNKEDSVLKRGTIITSINGKKNATITKEIFKYISSDGNAFNYKSQSLSSNFTSWYRNIFGIDSNYVITYLDSLHQEKAITIKAHSPKIDTTQKKVDNSVVVVQKKVIDTLTSKQKKERKLLALRSFTIDTSINTAFIRLTTFSTSKLHPFIKKSFKELEEKQIKNLVIDLRENGGGSVSTSIYLLKHLMDSSFKIADTVAAKTRKLAYKSHIKGWFGNWFVLNFIAGKKADNLYHLNRYETHYYQPKTTHHFNGNVYIIQGGFTFSAATIFSSFLKGQKNVTIVGEESGGGYYGNSAMQIPTIILPNTKLQVRLPLYKYVMDKNRTKGNGVLPDIEINPSSEAIKNGIDAKMVAVRNLIAAIMQ